MMMMMTDPITPPPPHLLKKFSAQAQDETKKRNGAGYLKTFATLCIEWAMNSQSTSNDRQIRSSEIQPPPELVMKWINNHYGGKVHRDLGGVELSIATQAAQWGDDYRLEACLNWLAAYQGLEHPELLITLLRAAMRPQPPSPKDAALEALAEERGDMRFVNYQVIRSALEQLDD